jgi:hypothetical protein
MLMEPRRRKSTIRQRANRTLAEFTASALASALALARSNSPIPARSAFLQVRPRILGGFATKVADEEGFGVHVVANARHRAFVSQLVGSGEFGDLGPARRRPSIVAGIAYLTLAASAGTSHVARIAPGMATIRPEVLDESRCLNFLE